MLERFNTGEHDTFCGFAEAYCNRLHCKDCAMDGADEITEEEVSEYINNFEVC